MKTKQRIDTLIDAHVALRRREKRDRKDMENKPDSEGSADSSPSPVLPDCPFCFAPLPEGKRHSCVPLRGRVHADPSRAVESAVHGHQCGKARCVECACSIRNSASLQRWQRPRRPRAIWYFCSKNSNRVDLGFLHGFYLQTLNLYGR